MVESVDGGPTDTDGQLYYAILYKVIEHMRICVSAEGPGTNTPMDVAG